MYTDFWIFFFFIIEYIARALDTVAGSSPASVRVVARVPNDYIVRQRLYRKRIALFGNRPGGRKKNKNIYLSCKYEKIVI